MPRGKKTNADVEVQDAVSDTKIETTASEKIIQGGRSPIPDVVFLRKINKLAKLNRWGAPKFYGQEKFKPDSNSSEDVQLEFSGNAIPGAFRNLTPQWNRLEKKWAWHGTYNDLTRIADRLKLRGKDQKVIVPDPYCFTNREDPFFNHPTLFYNKEMMMRDGTITLETNTPLDEFYARCYYGNPMVQDKTKNQSKSTLSGAELEIWSPKAEVRAKRSESRNADKAIVLLASMTTDKMRLIAQVMRPSGFDPKTEDTDALYVELREGAALNENTNDNRFGGMTWQERFIGLAEYDDTELFVMAKIIDAKYKGALIKKKGTFHFLTKPLYGDNATEVKDEIDLINFFRRNENDAQFQQLVEWLEDNTKK